MGEEGRTIIIRDTEIKKGDSGREWRENKNARSKRIQVSRERE